MKFHAEVVNVGLLMRLSNTVGKVSRQCVLLVTEEAVRLIAETPISDGTSLWVGMPPRALLEAVVLRSAVEGNAVALALGAEHLERAARSGLNAQACRVRLRRRGGRPVLSFTADVGLPQPLTVTQDVPCTPLNARAIRGLLEPDLPPPSTAVALPALKQLRGVVDHLARIADTLTLTVASDGSLTLEANTPTVTVAATYSSLPMPVLGVVNAASVSDGAVDASASAQGENNNTSTSTGSSSTGVPSAASTQGGVSPAHVGTPPVPVNGAAAGAGNAGAPRRAFSADVTASKLARFLPCAQLRPERVICCVVERYNIVMHAVVGDVYLTYFIPVLCS